MECGQTYHNLDSELSGEIFPVVKQLQIKQKFRFTRTAKLYETYNGEKTKSINRKENIIILT